MVFSTEFNKILTKVAFMLLFFTTVCLGCFGNNEEQSLIVNMSLCNFEINEIYLRANLSFWAIFKFDIDENDHPTRISRIDEYSNRYLDINQVVDCVSNWEIKGFNTKNQLSLIMYWKHGVGWTWVYITDNTNAFSIKIPPGFNRYYARGEHWQHDEGGPVDQHIRDVEERTRAQFEE